METPPAPTLLANSDFKPGLTMSFVPVLMAYDAAPDAPVYMTHAGMMERVRYLERWSRQHKNLCDDRHKWTVDRVKWMVDRVNYLTGKIEALSRNIDKYLDVKTDAVLDIKTDMDSVKTMTHDLKSDIDRINSVLLKIDPDAIWSRSLGHSEPYSAQRQSFGWLLW